MGSDNQIYSRKESIKFDTNNSSISLLAAENIVKILDEYVKYNFSTPFYRQKTGYVFEEESCTGEAAFHLYQTTDSGEHSTLLFTLKPKIYDETTEYILETNGTNIITIGENETRFYNFFKILEERLDPNEIYKSFIAADCIKPKNQIYKEDIENIFENKQTEEDNKVNRCYEHEKEYIKVIDTTGNIYFGHYRGVYDSEFKMTDAFGEHKPSKILTIEGLETTDDIQSAFFTILHKDGSIETGHMDENNKILIGSNPNQPDEFKKKPTISIPIEDISAIYKDEIAYKLRDDTKSSSSLSSQPLPLSSQQSARVRI